MFIAIIIFLLICIGLGLFHIKNINTIQQFALGYKGGIGTGVLIATLYATHIGAGASLGALEMATQVGAISMIVLFLSPLPWLMLKLIFANNVGFFSGCLTQSDITHKLYGRSGLIVSNITLLGDTICSTALQISALGYIFQQFIGLSPQLGMLISSLVVIIYSASGGIKGVILTDILQAAVFCFVLPLIAIVILGSSYGNWGEVLTHTPLIVGNESTTSITLTIFGMMVYYLCPHFGGPFIQRFLISGKPRQLHQAFTRIIFMEIILAFCLGVIGLYLLTVTRDGMTREDILFHMTTVLPEPLIISCVVAIIAVCLSTADSWINNGAVLIAHDMFKIKYPQITEKQEVWVARLSTVVLGIFSTALVYKQNDILGLLLLGLNFSIPIMAVPLCVGFLGYRPSEKNFVRSVTCAVIGVFIGYFIQGGFDFPSLLIGTIGSVIGLFSMDIWKMIKLKVPSASPKEFPPAAALFIANSLALHTFLFGWFPMEMELHLIAIVSFLSMVIYNNKIFLNLLSVILNILFCLIFILSLLHLPNIFILLLGVQYYLITVVLKVDLKTQFKVIFSSFGLYVLYLLTVLFHDFPLFAPIETKIPSNLLVSFLQCFFVSLNVYLIKRQHTREIGAISQYQRLVAHDLQSPLTSLCYLAESSVKKNGEWQANVNAAIRELSRTINILIDERVGTYTSESIIEEALKSVVIKRHISKIEVITSSSHKVVCNYGKTLLIIRELIINSLKYSEKEDLKVIISSSEEGEITVSDNGKGIIGDPFELPLAPHSRSGLGLHLCKDMLEEMRGSIYYTKENHSKFTIYLPTC